MKKLQGTVSIGRVSGNYSPSTPVVISLTDAASRAVVVEARMSLEAFALALTGMGHQPCFMEYEDSPIVGMKREYKAVAVALKDNYDRKEVREALSLHEVDGWLGRDEDCRNHHNTVSVEQGRKVMTVGFVRHVPQAEGGG